MEDWFAELAEEAFCKYDMELVSYLAYFSEISPRFKVPIKRDTEAGIYIWNTLVQSPPLSVVEKGREYEKILFEAY